MTLLDFRQMLDDFNPNNADLWLCYEPACRGNSAYKVTIGRRGALTKFGKARYAALYRMGPNGWEIECRKAREDYNGRCSHCSGATIFPDNQVANSSGWIAWSYFRLGPNSNGVEMIDTGTFVYERDAIGKISDPVKLMFLCEACWKLFP